MGEIQKEGECEWRERERVSWERESEECDWGEKGKGGVRVGNKNEESEWIETKREKREREKES